MKLFLGFFLLIIGSNLLATDKAVIRKPASGQFSCNYVNPIDPYDAGKFINDTACDTRLPFSISPLNPKDKTDAGYMICCTYK